jgi:death on curing protein
MAEPKWISKRVPLLLHEESLAEFGGARGLRDEGLLDSALARPHNIYAYNADSIADLAAAYAFGLAKKPCFHRWE